METHDYPVIENVMGDWYESTSITAYAQQFINGCVIPADLAPQSAASKKYVDDQLAIREKTILA